MNYELTEHARESLRKRAIQTEWLERVLLRRNEWKRTGWMRHCNTVWHGSTNTEAGSYG